MPGRTWASLLEAACLSLPGFACCVFGVARCLLVLLERCIGLGLGDAVAFLARPFFDESLCFSAFLSRASRLSLLGSDTVGDLPCRRAQLSCCFRFQLC